MTEQEELDYCVTECRLFAENMLVEMILGRQMAAALDVVYGEKK